MRLEATRSAVTHSPAPELAQLRLYPHHGLLKPTADERELNPSQR
jgi:hypothetical protein